MNIKVAQLAAALALVGSLGPASPALARAWPMWGNDRLNDCTFAAAANWELAALHHRASETTVIREYRQMGSPEGLTAYEFATIWETHGIGGVRATLYSVPDLDQWQREGNRGSMTELVASNRYLLATMTWEGSDHDILIVGASSKGLRVVTWGEEQTVRWHDWWNRALEVDIVTAIGYSR